MINNKECISICAICGKSFKSILSLSKHINIHNISKEEYYKKYILKSDNINCPYCKQRPLKFHNLHFGYYATCGDNKCRYLSLSNILFLNYGIVNVFLRLNVISKALKTKNKNNGVNVEKARKTRMLKNNGNWHNETFGYKCQLSKLKHYGNNANLIIGKNISLSKLNRTLELKDLELLRYKESMKLKYGYEFPMQIPEVKEKVKLYCIDTYGVTTTWVLSNGNKISNLNKRIFKILDNNHIQYEKEFKIQQKFFDIKIGNILLEINGDYWHANPSIYKANDLIQYRHNIKKFAYEIWKYDEYKKSIAELNNYIVKYIWESEIKLMSDLQLLNWLKVNCKF